MREGLEEAVEMRADLGFEDPGFAHVRWGGGEEGREVEGREGEGKDEG